MLFLYSSFPSSHCIVSVCFFLYSTIKQTNNKTPKQIFLLAMLLMSSMVSAGSSEDDVDDFDEEEDEDEKEREPIAKRQLTAMRDTVKSVMGNGVKLLTNARFVKGVSNFVQKAPAATGSAVTNLFQAVRSHWVKQSTSAQQVLIKQLQGLTKRLSNSRLLIGNIGAKLSNREESATKNTKADDVAPTSLPKQESERKEKSIQESSKHDHRQRDHQQLMPMHHPYPFAPPIAQVMHPLPMYHHDASSAFFAPPPIQPLDPMIMDPMYAGGW